MKSVRRLFDISKSILKTHVTRSFVPPPCRALPSSPSVPDRPVINDFGDIRYDLIRDLLFLMKAEQLLQVEEQSPHLMDDDQGELPLHPQLLGTKLTLCRLNTEIWKHLCINDFVQVRCLVEDNKMNEPSSWRSLHADEVLKREARLEGILAKMRGTYQQHADSRGTIKEVDGVAAAKKRKVVISSGGAFFCSSFRRGRELMGIAARPKSLYDKARSQSRQISSIYAPQRTQRTTSIPSSSRPRSSLDPPRRKPPKITTIIRKTQMPNPRPPLPPSATIPAATRPIVPLPSRSALLSSPPPPPPTPSNSTASTRPRPPRLPSLFLPKTKAR